MELQQRTTIILLVEISSATLDEKSQIQQHLMGFVRGYVQSAEKRLIGIIYYGATVEVAADLDIYRSSDELTEAVEDMHFIGGAPDTLLAVKTAHQLFSEKEDANYVKLLFHVHTPIPPTSTRREVDKVAQENGIVIVDLERSKW